MQNHTAVNQRCRHQYQQQPIEMPRWVKVDTSACHENESSGSRSEAEIRSSDSSFASKAVRDVRIL